MENAARPPDAMKEKARGIDGKWWHALEATFLVVLAILVWGLFALPSVFYLRRTTTKVQYVAYTMHARHLYIAYMTNGSG